MSVRNKKYRKVSDEEILESLGRKLEIRKLEKNKADVEAEKAKILLLKTERAFKAWSDHVNEKQLVNQ